MYYFLTFYLVDRHEGEVFTTPYSIMEFECYFQKSIIDEPYNEKTLRQFFEVVAKDKPQGLLRIENRISSIRIVESTTSNLSDTRQRTFNNGEWRQIFREVLGREMLKRGG